MTKRRRFTVDCQRRTKIAAVGQRKDASLAVISLEMLRVVPVVHRRGPRGFV